MSTPELGISAGDVGESMFESRCSLITNGAAGKPMPVIEHISTPCLIRDNLELKRSFDNAPHLKLTEDVLRHIFSWCTDSCVDLHLREVPFSLILTHVCAFWRRVALDTPELWNYICLDYKQAENPHVQLWFSRATRFHMSVLISDTMDDHHLNLFISSFLNLYRIRYLSIVTTCQQLRTFMSTAKNEMVEELALSSLPPGSTPMGSRSCPFFPFPNLKEIYVSSAHHCLGLDWLQYVSWERLCSLSLRIPIYPSELCRFLRGAVTLESLYVFQLESDAGYLVSEEVVTLPHLKDLVIEVYGRGGIDGYFIWWDSKVFSHLARQSNFGQLLDLCIDGYVLENLNIAKLLEDVPQVRMLRLPKDTEIADDTLTRLAKGELGSRLCSLIIGDILMDPQSELSIRESRGNAASQDGQWGMPSEVAPVEVGDDSPEN
ncbi:hypothetical protein AMATHDRAFT_5603 [Amanita thiersii Skay4041]|uniref:Uncharacterized protein n=1 Tax=Amanita thiersii Skay4041 TaxID=703135 RepID=A0A2A9NLT0_9AGAR|nr:hypothetical protein AMATHDRAFT_5603 [Amanita thiersii Skay4041]